MIKFDNFEFVAPPRTGTTWFCQAASLLGFGDPGHNGVHLLPPKGWNGEYTVSMVRHPLQWAISYYYALKGGMCGEPVVDRFAEMVKRSINCDEFLVSLTAYEGCVGEMFDAYPADTVLRLEDLPWAAQEFFQSLTPKQLPTIELDPANCRKGLPHEPSRDLRKRFMRSERAFCSNYDYS